MVGYEEDIESNGDGDGRLSEYVHCDSFGDGDDTEGDC